MWSTDTFTASEKRARNVDIHTTLFPFSLKSCSINTSSAVGGRRDEAVSTPHNTTTLSLISSPSPRDYRHKRWVGSFGTLHSRFLSPPSLSIYLLTLSSCILISFPSLSFINSLGCQLCWGDIPLSSYTGPAAVNCSEKIYYVQSRQRDSDHTNKQGLVELRWWKQWLGGHPLVTADPFLTPFKNKKGLWWVCLNIHFKIQTVRQKWSNIALKFPAKFTECCIGRKATTTAKIPLHVLLKVHHSSKSFPLLTLFYFLYLRHLSPYLSLHLPF